MTKLEEIVLNLINSKKEGDYWDFKEFHHGEPGDLVKDIICLANTPKHDGDRYIIFGVADDFSVPGVTAGKGKPQADIINMLEKSGFAGNNYPDIYLRKLSIYDVEVQVLLIKDLSEKPYYLQTEYNKRGVRLNPGTIYSRVRDSNTSSDQVASATDIELMWRERFGLKYSPLQRMRKYLLNFDAWTEASDNSWYYSDFPEFTISKTVDEISEVAAGENWVRAATSPKAWVRPMKLSYHQTILENITCIYYDEMRELIPAPKVNINPFRYDLWFFAIVSGSLDFLFLQFLSKMNEKSLLREGLHDGRGLKVPVILFSSSEEQRRFVEEIKTNPVTVENRHSPNLPSDDKEISEIDRRIISYSYAVIERFNAWKSGDGA